jgi:hypothetical protein
LLTASVSFMIISSTIWESVVFVLLMRGISWIRRRDGLRWHDIYIPRFMEIDIDIQTILWLFLRNSRGCNAGITDGRDLWCMALRWLHVGWYCNGFNQHARIEEVVLSMSSAPRLVLVTDQWTCSLTCDTCFLCDLRNLIIEELCFLSCPCHGYITRVEYLHRDPASR